MLAVRRYFNCALGSALFVKIPTSFIDLPLLPICRGKLKVSLSISIKLYCLGIHIRTMDIQQPYLRGRVDFRVLRNNLFFGYKYQGQSYYLVTAR